MATYRDYRDLLSELNGAGVEYLVVGAYAFAFHAEPRYTKDIDIWVNATPENARRVFQALARFGAPLGGVRVEDFATPGLIYQIGVEPVRVDILTSVSGLAFGEAYARRATASYSDIPMPVLSIEDLIASKEAAGRPRDLEDARILRQKLAGEA